MCGVRRVFDVCCVRCVYNVMCMLCVRCMLYFLCVVCVADVMCNVCGVRCLRYVSYRNDTLYVYGGRVLYYVCCV